MNEGNMRTLDITMIMPEIDAFPDEKLHIWSDEDGFYSCLSGNDNGNYWESDDFGPFETEDEAIDFVKYYINNR